MAATRQWRPSEAQKERNRLIRKQRAADRRAARRRWLKSLEKDKQKT
jgi:hypothetical protein